MERYNIAILKSRYTASNIPNESWTWDEIRGRLRAGTATSETLAEYRAMSKSRRDDVKDIGGFIGGYLSNGRRTKGSVFSRSMLTLDYDKFGQAQLERLEEALSGTAWALYSTHSHTPEAWKVRVIVPLSRNASPDEFAAVARKTAERCGMDGLDKASFQPGQLMYWGSHPKDVEYFYKDGEGSPLDVDLVLSEYPHGRWQDLSLWPKTAGEKEETADFTELAPAGGSLTPRCGGALADPREKPGLVGAFCRTYDIHSAISRFIPEVYTRVGDHYHHEGSKTGANAKTHGDGMWLYSFHATDPAQGRMLNAWDLVRIHLFGDLDRTGSPISGRAPSQKAMEDMALSDPSVKAVYSRERNAQVCADFDGMDSDEEGSTEGIDEWKEWEERKDTVLTSDKKGIYKSEGANVCAILTGDPRVAGKVKFDEFSGRLVVAGPLPWRRTSPYWGENDLKQLRNWMDCKYRIRGSQVIEDALVAVACSQSFHPVREYLKSLRWDGTPRVERLFTDILGAEDTEANRELARLFCVAAVRRVTDPGCKFDYLIILMGAEGTYKSSMADILGGDWFSDSLSTFEGKESMESVQGSWILEMPELDTFKKSVETLQKKFISKRQDKFRPAYGHYDEIRPRQCVMIGTTNEDQFLRGINAKNRRTPVVEIDPALRKIAENPREWLTTNRDQIWAEAVELEKGYGPLTLSGDSEEALGEVKRRHNMDWNNPIYESVEMYLNTSRGALDWERLSRLEKREWWAKARAGDGSMDGEGVPARVSIREIMDVCLDVELKDKNYNTLAMRLGEYLRREGSGWRFAGSKRDATYGVVKCYERTEPPETDDLLDMM